MMLAIANLRRLCATVTKKGLYSLSDAFFRKAQSRFGGAS